MVPTLEPLVVLGVLVLGVLVLGVVLLVLAPCVDVVLVVLGELVLPPVYDLEVSVPGVAV